MRLNMKKITFDRAYSFLADYCGFTLEELALVCSGWGSTMETLNTACHVRFGMTVEQLMEDYPAACK